MHVHHNRNQLSKAGKDKLYAHTQTATDPRNVQVGLYLQALFVSLQVLLKQAAMRTHREREGERLRLRRQQVLRFMSYSAAM